MKTLRKIAVGIAIAAASLVPMASQSPASARPVHAKVALACDNLGPIYYNGGPYSEGIRCTQGPGTKFRILVQFCKVGASTTCQWVADTKYRLYGGYSVAAWPTPIDDWFVATQPTVQTK